MVDIIFADLVLLRHDGRIAQLGLCCSTIVVITHEILKADVDHIRGKNAEKQHPST
jgi:hypothetical protein